VTVPPEVPPEYQALHRIQTHEHVCVERYKRIDERLDEMEEGIHSLSAKMAEHHTKQQAAFRWIIGLMLTGLFAIIAAFLADDSAQQFSGVFSADELEVVRALIEEHRSANALPDLEIYP
jgi:hypothetical protein